MITIKTLKDTSAQEVFDQVVKHLKTQRMQALDREGACRYRGEAHTICAAGCLISDAEYNEDMEGHSWIALMDCGVVPRAWAWLIADLQKIHDTIHPSLWDYQLRAAAKEHKLIWNENDYA